MKYFNLFLLINLLFVFYSCNEDDLQSIADSANSENIDLGKINVVDGRLYFPNLETFQAYYYDVKEKGEYEVADILGSNFYNKGFHSLVPILNERTEEQARNFFYSSLWDGVKNFMLSQYNKDLKKAGVVIVTPTATWTQFYDLSTDCTSCDKKERIIDWGAGASIRFNPETGAISAGVAEINKPKGFTGYIYGLAKKNGQWHGSKFAL